MNKKVLWVVVGLAVVLVLGVLFPRPQNPADTSYLQQLVQDAVSKLGSVVGNEVQGKEFIVGGVKYFSAVPEGGGPIASTTPCTILSPNATTSIISLVVSFNAAFATTSSGVAPTMLDIATSTVRNATTSLLWNIELNPSNAFTLALNATSSPNGSSNFILPPNTFVNVGVRGNDAVSRPIGQCTLTGVKVQ